MWPLPEWKRPEQARPEQTRLEQARLEQARTAQARPEVALYLQRGGTRAGRARPASFPATVFGMPAERDGSPVPSCFSDGELPGAMPAGGKGTGLPTVAGLLENRLPCIEGKLSPH